MGLFDKLPKKKSAARPGVVGCPNNPARSWIIFHVFDATVGVNADFAGVDLDTTNLDDANQSLKTVTGTGEATATFNAKGGTFSIEQMQSPSDDHVYFVDEVGSS
jgi:hypothetical protein